MIEVVRNAVTVYQIQRLGGKFAAIQVKQYYNVIQVKQYYNVIQL